MKELASSQLGEVSGGGFPTWIAPRTGGERTVHGCGGATFSGAAAGAVSGGLIGGPPGTAVGVLIGGVVGFALYFW